MDMGNRHTDLFFLQDLCERPVYPLGVEVQAELSDDETTPRLEEPPVRAEKVQQVHHESFEIAFVGAG